MNRIFQTLLLLFGCGSALAQQLISDGPHVFQEGDRWVSYSIRDGELIKESLPDNKSTTTLEVLTDEPGKTFEVSLKPGLGYELASYEMPQKLVAISDIEGEFGAFRKLLQATGVINKNLDWRFGKGHLVLTGDFFDRGNMVTEVLWLIYKLEWEAYEAGGQVHFILGNHETMNLQGDLRYVHPKYKQSAELMDKQLIDLYSGQTELGQWLRTKNIVEKIGDHLFVHAGISQKVNELSLPIEELSSLARPFYDRDASNADQKVRILMSQHGPLWYRGYYMKGPVPEVIDQTLQQYGASKIITGHTVVADTISTHYDGKLINIDTRHSEGKSEALFIRKGKTYRVDINGKRRLLFSGKKHSGNDGVAVL